MTTKSMACTSTGGADASELFPEHVVNRSIGNRFHEMAQQYPDRLALIHGGRTRTYRELDRSARAVSRALGQRSRKRTGHVGLLIADPCDMVSAILGTLMIGAVYVPLDPAYPQDRLRSMMQDADLDVIVHDVDSAALPVRFDHVETFEITQIFEVEPMDPREIAVSPDAVASLLYTSGSTGAPKGVLQTHRNILFHVRNLTNEFRITAFDRHSALASFSFDASTTDLFCTVLNGAALVRIDIRHTGLVRLREELSRQRVTLYHSTPTVFRHLDPGPVAELNALRVVLLGGEPVTRRDAQIARDRLSPSCALVNGYGATETSGFLALGRVEIDSPTCEATFPIGKALDGIELTLRTEDGGDATQMGQLVAFSNHLGVGYWGDPQSTAAKFGREQRNGQVVSTYYTGDLAEQVPQGFRIIGRLDRQLKYRGVRLDAAEVEEVLVSVEGVTAAAVCLTDEEEHGVADLVAFIRADRPLDPATVSIAAGRFLPVEMLPTKIIAVDNLPLTPTGKTDYNALLNMLSEVSAGDEPGATDDSSTIDGVRQEWRKLLGRSGIPDDQNFFDAGGRSLLLGELRNRLERRFGRPIPLARLFESATIAGMAELLDTSGHGDSNPHDAALLERLGDRVRRRRRAVYDRRRS